MHPYYQAMLDANLAAGRPYFHQLSAEDAKEQMRATMAAAPVPADLPELAQVLHEEIGINGTQINQPITIAFPDGCLRIQKPTPTP